ncbi:unnamed protein product [Prunus armeniaca]|uniref:Uncharacterized protein n=1 Tax=Prunus armeniaca TaxID=36596 RepID=A0A6J5U4S1_PRUAR|nr:unnamed protein product [Prunus armeniaca]CAB4301722.1 unnamed protein product [Prunus armeniaca]
MSNAYMERILVGSGLSWAIVLKRRKIVCCLLLLLSSGGCGSVRMPGVFDGNIIHPEEAIRLLNNQRVEFMLIHANPRVEADSVRLRQHEG